MPPPKLKHDAAYRRAAAKTKAKARDTTGLAGSKLADSPAFLQLAATTAKANGSASHGPGYGSGLAGSRLSESPAFLQLAADTAAGTGGVPGSAPGGSTPGAPPPPGPLTPFNAAMETSISNRQKAQGLALSALDTQGDATTQEFYDPNDPHSRQADLRRRFQQIKGAQGINQASSGQLYSGSSQMEDASTLRDEGFAGVDLKRQFDQIMGGLEARRRSENAGAADDIDGYLRQGAAQYAAAPENSPLGDTAPPPVVAPVAAPVAAPKAAKPPSAAMIARVKKRWQADKKAGKR